MNSPTPPPFPLSFKRIESRFHVLLTPFVRCASRCFEVITRSFSPFLLLFSKIFLPSESRRGKTRRVTQVFSKKGREIADTGVITNKFSTRNEARKRERVNPKAQRKGLGKRTRGDRLKIRDVFSISSRDIRNCCLCFSSRRRLRLSFELFDLPRHPSLSPISSSLSLSRFLSSRRGWEWREFSAILYSSFSISPLESISKATMMIHGGIKIVIYLLRL